MTLGKIFSLESVFSSVKWNYNNFYIIRMLWGSYKHLGLLPVSVSYYYYRWWNWDPVRAWELSSIKQQWMRRARLELKVNWGASPLPPLRTDWVACSLTVPGCTSLMLQRRKMAENRIGVWMRVMNKVSRLCALHALHTSASVDIHDVQLEICYWHIRQMA